MLLKNKTYAYIIEILLLNISNRNDMYREK